MLLALSESASATYWTGPPEKTRMEDFIRGESRVYTCEDYTRHKDQSSGQIATKEINDHFKTRFRRLAAPELCYASAFWPCTERGKAQWH